MLTDTIVEEEFELEEEEPWLDQQDLEHDLQLAAELGKSLLERNQELEQGLQQMSSCNQEQQQEIEHLAKQVELLRQVNEQHARVYEQLDVSARELEQNNHQLLLDKRTAQQKLQSLVETVELLQAQLEELQQQLEELKLSPPRSQGGGPRGAQSESCLQELQSSLRCGEEPSDSSGSSLPWWEEERASLQQSLRALQTQFASERAHREELEHQAQLLSGENEALEQRLSGMEACRVRVSELEQEVEELRQLWKSSSRPDLIHTINPVFLSPEEDSPGRRAKTPSALRRWDSERLLRATITPPDSPARFHEHECTCARRADLMKYRGMSLFHEVDAQYSALQAKYEELLKRCHRGEEEEQEEEEEEEQEEQEEQEEEGCSQTTTVEEDHQPEYKKIFKQIFSHIQKSKKDLGAEGGARGGASGAAAQPR